MLLVISRAFIQNPAKEKGSYLVLMPLTFVYTHFQLVSKAVSSSNSSSRSMGGHFGAGQVWVSWMRGGEAKGFGSGSHDGIQKVGHGTWQCLGEMQQIVWGDQQWPNCPGSSMSIPKHRRSARCTCGVGFPQHSVH
uniref:Uncharacterized protein n=1 Tax=Eutreptiella gymnastica TaxID=73025 RepID=A0A7S4FZB0_9EUGL